MGYVRKSKTDSESLLSAGVGKHLVRRGIIWMFLAFFAGLVALFVALSGPSRERIEEARKFREIVIELKRDFVKSVTDDMTRSVDDFRRPFRRANAKLVGITDPMLLPYVEKVKNLEQPCVSDVERARREIRELDHGGFIVYRRGLMSVPQGQMYNAILVSVERGFKAELSSIILEMAEELRLPEGW